MREWETFTNQKQWRDYIVNLLKTNDKALCRAIVVLYEMQTDEEKMKGEAIDNNGCGFGKVDAAEMGRVARKIMHNQPLEASEWARMRNKVPKYWKQLMNHAKRLERLRAVQSEYQIPVTVEESGQIRLKV